MKKPNLLVGILIVILIFTSCSNNNDDNSTNDSNIEFNPPEWIIGTWIHDGGANGTSGEIFTSNDVIRYSDGMSLSDFYNLDEGWVLRESSSSNTYKYAVYSETMGFTSWNREFKKIDENTMIFECCPSQPFTRQ